MVCPTWNWALQTFLCTDVPVHYPVHLVMPFIVCCPCLHHTSCYTVADCLRGIFAQPAPFHFFLLQVVNGLNLNSALPVLQYILIYTQPLHSHVRIASLHSANLFFRNEFIHIYTNAITNTTLLWSILPFLQLRRSSFWEVKFNCVMWCD